MVLLLAALTLGALVINRATSHAHQLQQTRHSMDEERFTMAKDRVGCDFSAFIFAIQQYVSHAGSSNDALSYFVAVDVGATNTRVSVVIKLRNHHQDRHHHRHHRVGAGASNAQRFELDKFQCSSVDQLLDVLHFLNRELLTVFGGQGATAAALALAGPIDKSNHHVTLTNYDEGCRVLDKHALPSGIFPFEKTRFLNDLEACCYGVISDGINGDLDQYFTSAFEKTTTTTNESTHVSSSSSSSIDHRQKMYLEQKSYAVLAMGTGLGCGLIICNGKSDEDGSLSFVPLALEAGHVLVGNVGTKGSSSSSSRKEDYEKTVSRFQYLSQSEWNGEYGIEYEDICSGRGLKNCYQFEFAYAHQPVNHSATPGDIAQTYQSDRYARMALEAHYGYLMRAAQNICVMIPSCKGVFFAGDNQVDNEPFVSENLDSLKEQFLDHQKKSWLTDVVAFRQVKKKNFNMAGCEYLAMSLE